jgi:zinc protease
MRTRAAVPCVLALAGCLLAPAPAAPQARDWKEIAKPPLPAFAPQQPRRVVLPNGMVVLLQEDHELPLVRGFARIRGGSRDEPADKAGLVSLFGQAWRTGGTARRTGDQLDDFLEGRAATVETGGGLEFTTISWDCLKGDLDDVLSVTSELLREPEFREDKLVLARTQLNTGIARRNDNPLQIAGREITRLGYGPASPYARSAEYHTVAAVTRQDLLDWHRKHVHPGNLILGVVGDFSAPAMEAKLRALFASWPKGQAFTRPREEFKEPAPGVYFVRKDDVNQSQIRMVHLGTTRKDPDYHALEVMNEVFGGGFGARLFSNVRSKKGLAYSVSGGVGTAYDRPGLFTLSMGTKSESTAAGIDALYEELDDLLRKPATDVEVAKAKDAILNSFVFRYDSKAKILQERVTLEFYGYPQDFLDRYRAGIEKVTAADVARVAQQHVHKDRLAVLVVGKAEDFDRPLSSFGPVTTVDITIPDGKPAAQAASASGGAGTAPASPGASGAASAPGAGADAEGRRLASKVAEGLGGLEKVRVVKGLRRKASVLAKTPQGDVSIEVEGTVFYPDRIAQKMQTPMGTMSMVVTPETSFLDTPMGSRDLPASQKEDLLKESRRDPVFVVQHLDDPKFAFSPGGTEKVGEVEAAILDVNADGAEARWWVDPGSGRILRTAATVVGRGGPGRQVIDYSDFRTVDGLVVAFKQAMTRDGQPAASAELREIEVNPSPDPKVFEKPATAAGPGTNP